MQYMLVHIYLKIVLSITVDALIKKMLWTGRNIFEVEEDPKVNKNLPIQLNICSEQK